MITFNLLLFLTHAGGRSGSLQSAQEKNGTQVFTTTCSVAHINCLPLTCLHQRTREMLTPVSFSTAAGSLVMMSSTSPVSLAAPTSEPPLDTIVTLLAAVRGLLISSAICRQGSTRTLIERRSNLEIKPKIGLFRLTTCERLWRGEGGRDQTQTKTN